MIKGGKICAGVVLFCSFVLWQGCSKPAQMRGTSVEMPASGSQPDEKDAMNRPGGDAVVSEEQFVVTGSNGFCSADDWCWISTDTTGATLWDVWSHPDVAYAVGSGGTLLKLVNGVWRQIKLDTHMNLNGIWGTSPTNIYAVGAVAFHGDTIESGRASSALGIVLHFDGKHWQPIPDEAAGASSWNDVWVSETGEVFVVGDEGAILHFDTRQWTFQETQTDEIFNGVFGTSSSDVLAVGHNGAVSHYNGKRWRSWGEKPINQWNSWVSFYVAAALPSGELAAVGENGVVYRKDGTVHSWVSGEVDREVSVRSAVLQNGELYVIDENLFRYDGAQWQREEWPGKSMRAIHADESGRKFAVGNKGAIWQKETEQRQWKKYGKAPAFENETTCDDLMVGRNGKVHVVYYHELFEYQEHTNEWATVSLPQGATFKTNLFDEGVYLDDAAGANLPLDYFVRNGADVGLLAIGNLYRFSRPEKGVMMRYDGERWEDVEIPHTDYLKSLWCQRKDDCWAVGARGTILHSQGREWTQIDFEGYDDIRYEEIRTVHGDKETALFIGGMQGVLLEYRNQNWIRHELPATSNIDDLVVLAPDDVYAVTSNGWIAHYDGANWSIEDSGTSNYLSAIAVSKKQNYLIACGADGILKKKL
ncbi:MAG: hypothetical protein JXX29_14275 [Deltaproteobacteria bacterium]|nr:hypothetical protein [Deltaproteobacteria bacterium]MBN2672845.1 hypothetical protein [Deltaproteobacteria bacterium]